VGSACTFGPLSRLCWRSSISLSLDVSVSYGAHWRARGKCNPPHSTTRAQHRAHDLRVDSHSDGDGCATSTCEISDATSAKAALHVGQTSTPPAAAAGAADDARTLVGAAAAVAPPDAPVCPSDAATRHTSACVNSASMSLKAAEHVGHRSLTPVEVPAAEVPAIVAPPLTLLLTDDDAAPAAAVAAARAGVPLLPVAVVPPDDATLADCGTADRRSMAASRAARCAASAPTHACWSA
jgi:hypothetical protein